MRRQSPDEPAAAIIGDTLIPFPILKKKIGDPSRTTIWRLVRDNDLPQPTKIGDRNLWSEREIDGWIAARLARRGAK